MIAYRPQLAKTTPELCRTTRATPWVPDQNHDSEP
jgi:hypothetical protein